MLWAEDTLAERVLHEFLPSRGPQRQVEFVDLDIDSIVDDTQEMHSRFLERRSGRLRSRERGVGREPRSPDDHDVVR